MNKVSQTSVPVVPVVQPEPFDEVGFIMAYEGGELDDEDTIDGFQHLIDSGTVWHFQGSYGRMAQSLIDSGVCHAKEM